MALELSHSKIAVCGQRTPCHSVRESMAEGILGKKRSLSRQIGTSRVPNYTVPLRTRAVWKAYLFINYLWNTFKEVPCTSSSSMDSWGLGAQKDPRDPILQCYKFPDEKHQRSERSEWMTRLSSAVVAMTTWESRFSTPGPVLFPPCQPACCIDRWLTTQRCCWEGSLWLFISPPILFMSIPSLLVLHLGCRAVYLLKKYKYPWVDGVTEARLGFS